MLYLIFKPELAIPVALFVIKFAFIDFYLSYQFLKFDLISINYFYKVDQTVYKLNFNFLGKAANTYWFRPPNLWIKYSVPESFI